MTDEELLELHRTLVAIPSCSRAEGELADYLEGWLRARGVAVHRSGHNLWATVPAAGGRSADGQGPVPEGDAGALNSDSVSERSAHLLSLCSHLDTVPLVPGWTRPPFVPQREEGRVYGLGSNDAKASVAAMIAALLRLRGQPGAPPLLLALTCQEELGGREGAELLLRELADRGERPGAVIVGEPTGGECAVAQKGLLVLELKSRGQACHAAHRRALGAANALTNLARDLVALEGLEPGPPHPQLGPVTVEPTVAAGGTARNVVPAEASCILDVRVNPDPPPEEIVARLRAHLSGELIVLSDRLRPCAIAARHPLVEAVRRARPAMALVGSRGLSDLALFAAAGIAGIKVGPGRTERSHTPDEFVEEEELLAGARLYEDVARAYGVLVAAG